MNEQLRSAGWYPDHDGTGAERYWNGVVWTDTTRAETPTDAPKAGLERWFREVSRARLAALSVGVLAAFGWVLILVGNSSSTTGSPSHPLPPGAVSGSLSKSCDLFGCTSPDAARALRVSDVWCRWNAEGHVAVHARLENTMVANVKLSITPRYDIANGGQHGTSLGSDIEVDLAAGEATTWVGDAGAPAGVAPGARISKCKPHLYDISIG